MGITVDNVIGASVYVLKGGTTFAAKKSATTVFQPMQLNYTNTTTTDYYFVIAKAV